MHRSASTTRASDEYYLSVVAQSKAASPAPRSSRSAADLPTYDPQSEAGKKEAMRSRFADNMVHAIPLVLFMCGAILWLFSRPDFKILGKSRSIMAKIKNITN